MTPVPKARSAALALVAALALYAAAHEASARPGGGHSYSGGSSSHSSGSSRSYSGGSSRSYSGGSSSSSYGGGGGGDTAAFIFVVIGSLVYGVAAYVKQMESAQVYDTGPIQPSPPPLVRKSGTLAKLRERDPEFSTVLFEDFVYALYARVQAARASEKQMTALAAYVGDRAREKLLARDPTGVEIHGVVIGKMEVVRVSNAQRVEVDLVFEANYTAELPEGPQGFYIEERWSLVRAAGVTSKPPTDVYSFHCPSCGGPYERSDDGRCRRCAQVVEGGRFDWSLESTEVLRHERRPPTLTGEVEEQGTHLPSILEPGISKRYAKFASEDPGAALDVIERRTREIFAAMNTGWSSRDLRPIRPHVSDAFYNYLSYWIDAYKAQGLQNLLRDPELSRVQLVKLVRDRHYDAITVRIWARVIDTTVDARDGHLISGNPRRPRAYSEYWTLIRGAGVRGAPRSPGNCPNCGAPLDRVNMAGNCEYCGAHLTRGEFDWVLAKIEQDEAYTG